MRAVAIGMRPSGVMRRHMEASVYRASAVRQKDFKEVGSWRKIHHDKIDTQRFNIRTVSFGITPFAPGAAFSLHIIRHGVFDCNHFGQAARSVQGFRIVPSPRSIIASTDS